MMKKQEKIYQAIKLFRSKLDVWFEKNQNFQPRDCFEKCWTKLNNEQNNEFIILYGMRQVGKTTTLQQLAHKFFWKKQSISQIIYLSLDDVSLLTIEASDLLNYFHENLSREKKWYLFLDEIQNLPKWDILLKNIWDSFPNVKLIASGSSSLAINLTETGSFRFYFLQLNPLSFREYLSFQTQKITLPPLSLSKLPFWTETLRQLKQINLINPRLKHFFRKYFMYGSFPAFVNGDLSNLEYQEKIKKNVYQKAKDDVFRLYAKNPELFPNKVTPEIFDAIFVYLIENNGNLTSYQKISSQLEIPKNKVAHAFQLLGYASLLNPCRKIHLRGNFALNTSAKHYLSDHTLYLAFEQIKDWYQLSSSKGFLYETLIFNHLNQKTLLNKFGYFKNKNIEIDFVLFLEKNQKYLIESKSQHWVLQTLHKNFAVSKNHNFRKICVTEDTLQLQGEILFIPLYLFLLIKV